MSRAWCASALLMVSGIAAAVPVQLDLVYSDMYHGNAVIVGSGPGEQDIGDAYTRGILRNVDYDLILSNAGGGSGRAYTSFFQEINTSGSDDHFSATFDARLIATAGLTGPVDELSYALAEVGFNGFGMQFEVFEPVLYTGSFGVFADSFSPFEDYLGPIFESGSVLQPGTYAFTIAPYLRDSSLWLYNRVTTPGEVLTGTASANYAFGFASVIPTPATLSLLAFALGCMFFGRRFARARSR